MSGFSRRDALASGAVAGLAGLIPASGSAKTPETGDAPQLHGLAPRDTAPWAPGQPDPSRLLLDRGWLFHEGEIALAPPEGHHQTYLSVKAGNARGAAAIDFDDSDWQAVSLPHDWASAQPFVETANVSQGYRPRGIGWYRRTMRLDPADQGKRLELQFGGIATQATIWVNGSIVARNFSAYNAVTIDITPFARFGDDLNVIAVRVDATAMEGWWYEGAGIYRHVWLARRAPVSIATDGIHCDPRLVDGRWQVPVSVSLESIAAAPQSVTISATLRDPEGRAVATQSIRAEVEPLSQALGRMMLDAGAPRLWSVGSPTLYSVEVTVSGAQGDDRRLIPVGFRSIAFDPDRGFLLNDQPVKLKGVCLHQDHAGVGVAVPDALLAWRLQRLKDMGCNAIRCSHNAMTAEFYDLCDRMGFLVMDENRVFNPAPENMAQLEWLVRAHRNHPSIILWSVFNEEPMQGTQSGVEMVRRMRAAVRALDDSRPVTAAMNGSFYVPHNVSQVVDVMGFNYYPNDYDRFHALNPAKPTTSSEDTSAYMTRGAYASDPKAHVISSMDEEAADWGATHRKSWQAIAQRPFVAGGFVWTGFDYHGEPTPYAWPTIASFFGILDLCGFAKTAYDIRRAQWIDDEVVVGVAPHWTWPGREGQEIDLLVTSNADRVRVLVNGRPIGEQACDRVMGNHFSAKYAPGVLEVEALKGGRVVARTTHRTAGPAVALRLTPTRKAMLGDGENVLAITVDTVDAQGNHVPTEGRKVSFTLSGATVIGVGNGDPNSHESEKAPQRSLFNGLAQLIVQAPEGRGRIVVEAQAEGLRPARIMLPLLNAAARPSVPVQPSVAMIADWRRSPGFVERPDPAIRPAEGDNNLWAFTRSGTATEADAAATWRVYRAALPVRRRIVAQGGGIAFAAISGKAELWIDGARVATKATPAAGPLEASVPPGATEVALLVQSVPDTPSGITGSVRLIDRR
jgi:beta-galactosidase